MNEALIPLLKTVKDKDGEPLYCCVKFFLVKHRHVRTSQLADAWQLHRNTISNWRRKLKVGALPCARCANCKLRRN